MQELQLVVFYFNFIFTVHTYERETKCNSTVFTIVISAIYMYIYTHAHTLGYGKN